MRARLESLTNRKAESSFLCYAVEVPAFSFRWHYHPEYELTYIVSGRGERLVGDRYESFEAGDLVLLGPAIPHTWVSEKEKGQRSSAIVIQFLPAFIEPLLVYPEMDSTRETLSAAKRGLVLEPTQKDRVVELLRSMPQQQALDRMLSLLKVMGLLSLRSSRPLVSQHYRPLKGNENQHRINKVLAYVQKEFRENVNLRDAAELVNLSESAFCKFFKRVSGKTFSDYVNEVRIANATQSLMETDFAIAQIAAESGFETLTYFNRVFLKKKGKTPRQVRRMVH